MAAARANAGRGFLMLGMVYLNIAMVDVADILEFVDEVAARFQPQRILLFGSYAYGTPTEDSDVDILVVMNYRGKNHDQAIRIRLAINKTLPMDLLVHKQSDIDRRIRWHDCVLKEITEKGLVLYDANDSGVGRQSRRRLRRRLRAAEVA